MAALSGRKTILLLVLGLALAGTITVFCCGRQGHPAIGAGREFRIQGLLWRTVPYYEPGVYGDLYNRENSSRSIEKAVHAGANYLLVKAFYNGTPDGGLAGNEKEAMQHIGRAIAAAHERGIGILLSPYVESRDYWAERKWRLDENVWTETVLKWAEFAEKNRVEMFAPGIEMNLILEENVSGKWLRDILPEIRKVYRGKVVTAELYDIERWKIPDKEGAFRGYDCIGLTFFPRKNYNGTSDIRSFEDYREYMENESETLDSLSEKYGIPCKIAVPMGLDYWKGTTGPVPDAAVVARATGMGLDILKRHNFTGVFVSHWASEPDHFGKRSDVEAELGKRWSELPASGYIFEPDWWLEPQTFGMFNYYGPTDFRRLDATNCTVNGYRLVYSQDVPDYKDIEEAHRRGKKYILGMLPDTVNEDGACRPYADTMNSLLGRAEKAVDMDADGLAVIHPFGGDMFISERISCLCPENSSSADRQLECAVRFFHDFAENVRKYAESKGKTGFPVTVASHGEWLIPFTIGMLPYSDFAFGNLNFDESYIHSQLYRLHSAAGGMLVASPTDASFGWLVENSEKPDDLIQAKMAEAYANRGAFQDQYKAGLSPECAKREYYGSECWLDQSAGEEAVNRVNSFYLGNRELFTSPDSMSKMALLFSPASVSGPESEHWGTFNDVSRALTKSHYQYDVLFSGPELALENLLKYQVIVLPGNTKMDASAVSLIRQYVKSGGKAIAVNTVDSGIMDIPLTSLEWDSENRTLFREIDRYLGQKVSGGSLPETVGIRLWRTGNRTTAHLVNYDFDTEKGIIRKENLTVTVNLPLQKGPVRVWMISPDFPGKTEPDFSYNENGITVHVPGLRIWDIIIIEN